MSLVSPHTQGLTKAELCYLPKEGELPTQLPGLPYPVLLLPALGISLLPLHLQGDGSQAVLCPHQLL